MPAANPEEITEELESLGKTLEHISLEKVLSVCALILVCLIVIRIVMKLVNRLLERGKIEQSLHAFIRTGTKILLGCLAALIVADALGINVTSLIAVLSVAGLAVSLAVQSTLSNLAGGLQLLTTKPFKVGDYVDAGETSGTVQEIGMVHTKLLTPDNKLIYIPNSDVAAAKITNYSAQERRRVDLVFSASYDAAPGQVKAALVELIAAHPLALKDPEPFVCLSAYQDSCVEYTVRVWVENRDYWTVYFDLLEGAKQAFADRDIEMTYPHMNVHLLKQ